MLNKEIKIKKEDIETFLKNGYTLGRKPFSEKHKQNIKNANKHKKIHNIENFKKHCGDVSRNTRYMHKNNVVKRVK